MTELILRPPQVPMTDWLMKHKRSGLWAGMGIGKTSSTLVALDWLKILGEIDARNPTLVVGPMRVARDVWPQEVLKWDQFKDIRVLPITGTPDQRLRKLRIPADIYTISYELTPWLVETWLEKWPYRIVIADESDRLKGFREKSWTGHRTDKFQIGNDKKGRSGLRAYHLSRIAHSCVDRWINLTGTPAPAGLKDLWGQTWFLDRGAALGSTYGAFQRRWFRKSWDKEGKIEMMPGADKFIHEAVRDLYLTVDPADYFDLQKPIYHRITVDLPPQARKLYKQAKREMYIGLEELRHQPGGINIVNAGVLTQKCLQLANGALYDSPDHTTWLPVHEAKMEALDSIVYESGGSAVLVSVNFISDKERILKAFPSAVDLATKNGFARFKAGDAQVGVAHPKSMGHGIDGLQSVCNIIVFFGHDWKTGERLQIRERIGPMRQFQAGRTDGYFEYDIVARDTEDEHVMQVHHENKTVQEVLLEAMKREAI